MRRIIINISIITLLFLAFTAFAQEQVNINAVSCEELTKLPITEEQRDAICEQIMYGGGFNSVYELLDLGVFTPEEFETLKPLVSVSIVQGLNMDDPLSRVDNLYFRVSNWISGEDVSTSAIDDWIDAIVQSPTLADLGYRDLVSYQNVSPQDAFALLNHRKNVGVIQSRRQLKGIDNLSIGGYLGIRNFIGYGEPQKLWIPSGFVTTRFDASEADAYPYMHLRGRYSYGPFSVGVRLARETGERLEDDAFYNPAAYPQAKGYAAVTRYDLGPVRVRRFVLGDYSVCFGEGVTIGTADYFQSRQTGLGFATRTLGVSPDISSSETYTLRGAALELEYGMFEPTIFFSTKDKDVIMNDSTNTAFTDLAANMANWDDQVKENMFGADLTVMPTNNFRLGYTMYRASYDLPWSPDPGAIIDPEYLPWGDNPKVDARDAELFNMTYEQDYRSAMGIHATYNIGNLTFAGEYSEIVRDENVSYEMLTSGAIDTVFGDKTSPLPIGDDPYGLTAKAQLITNRFSMIAQYRHYDLGFDNPYNRGFANYARYKGSLVEKDYRLTSESLVAVAEDNPRPQAEDGIYFSFFGRVNRKLYGTFEYDAFKRLTDNQEYRRIVLKGNYRANSRLMFKIWQKWQGRAESNSIAPLAYEVNETRFTTVARLTDWSQVDFQLIHSVYQSPPRPSFSSGDDPDDDEPSYAAAADPSNALALGYSLNASERLTIKGQAIVYKGWLWNFENNDFAVLESEYSDAVRLWCAISDRMTKNLSVTLKVSVDTPMANSSTYIRDNYDSSVNESGGTIRNADTTWLLQLDYFF